MTDGKIVFEFPTTHSMCEVHLNLYSLSLSLKNLKNIKNRKVQIEDVSQLYAALDLKGAFRPLWEFMICSSLNLDLEMSFH